MRTTNKLIATAAVAVALFILAVACAPSAQQSPGEAVQMDADDIGGVVTSANGVEAGVWVIAETDDFETRFAKIVATDDSGRYLIPDLPSADYELWVRGYGLADSAKASAQPGQRVDLDAVVAPSPAVAAEVYPAAHWYSMMKMPEVSELPASLGGDLNQYVNSMKNNGCIGCHQLGNLATRTIPEELGLFESPEAAWMRRMASGQAGQNMLRQVTRLGGLSTRYLAEWSERIASGELPASIPERPTGLERNVVVTVRDWSSPTTYLHDLTTTDRRDPTVNGYGSVYGSPELSTDDFPILDPVRNVATTFRAPVRDEDTPSTRSTPPLQPSPYWGDESIWGSQANSHNPMVGPYGAGLVHGPSARAGQSCLLPRGLGSSVGAILPDEPSRAAPGRLRPDDRGLPLRRHLLFDAPPAVCLQRHQSHALDQRRWPSRRLAQHEDVRRDGRCRRIARLDPSHPSTPTAMGGRTVMSNPTSRSIRLSTSASRRGSTR